MVWSSITSTAPAMPRGWPSSPCSTIAPKRPRFDDPVAGSSQRLTVWATSAEVKASPLDQVMPSFR